MGTGRGRGRRRLLCLIEGFGASSSRWEEKELELRRVGTGCCAWGARRSCNGCDLSIGRLLSVLGSFSAGCTARRQVLHRAGRLLEPDGERGRKIERWRLVCFSWLKYGFIDVLNVLSDELGCCKSTRKRTGREPKISECLPSLLFARDHLQPCSTSSKA